MSKYFLLFLSASFLIACGGGGESAEPVVDDSGAGGETASAGMAPDLSQAGTVAGQVKFSGSPGDGIRIRMDAEAACAEVHGGPVTVHEVIVDENGSLANAVVWVKSGLEQYSFEPPSEAVELDQKGCIYSPHVIAVQTRQTIRISNSDPATHNVHPIPVANREWNQSQRPNAEALERNFPREEIAIPIKCNVHPWMKSFVAVVAHPYFAVTSADGSFNIGNLPPGNYTLGVWHETLGEQEQQITLEPNGSQTVEFSFAS